MNTRSDEEGNRWYPMARHNMALGLRSMTFLQKKCRFLDLGISTDFYVEWIVAMCEQNMKADDYSIVE